MAPKFRVIDTGRREGRANIAFDQALIEAHKAGTAPDTIRFLHFPPTALIGRHQDLSQELRLDHCLGKGIGVVRRITGGGAIYLDEGQLGWELAFHRKTLGIGNLADLTRAICEAAARGISTLGVDARFRPRNDIEVDGRKLCGTGGFFDGDTLFYQGTLLIDMNPAEMVAAINIPAAKLAKRNLESGTQRVVTLKELLGGRVPDMEAVKAAMLDGFAEGLAITPEWGEISAAEEALAQRFFSEEIGTEAFVREIDNPGADAAVLRASRICPGGTICAWLRLDGPRQDRIREVLFTGDFFVTPPRIIYDLEASLRGEAIADIPAAIERFFASARPDLLTLGPRDFRDVLVEASSHAALCAPKTP